MTKRKRKILSNSASKKRFNLLKKAGCTPIRVRLPNGDLVVLRSKNCPI